MCEVNEQLQNEVKERFIKKLNRHNKHFTKRVQEVPSESQGQFTNEYQDIPSESQEHITNEVNEQFAKEYQEHITNESQEASSEYQEQVPSESQEQFFNSIDQTLSAFNRMKESVDVSMLTEEQRAIYFSFLNLTEYKLPLITGKIVYNKEDYAKYCRLIESEIKSGNIKLTEEPRDIVKRYPFDPLPYKWKIGIIKKLTNTHKTTVRKSWFISRMDNDYINGILRSCRAIISKGSALAKIQSKFNEIDMNLNDVNTLTKFMKDNNISFDNLLQILSEHTGKDVPRCNGNDREQEDKMMEETLDFSLADPVVFE